MVSVTSTQDSQSYTKKLCLIKRVRICFCLYMSPPTQGYTGHFSVAVIKHHDQMPFMGRENPLQSQPSSPSHQSCLEFTYSCGAIKFGYFFAYIHLGTHSSAIHPLHPIKTKKS